VISDVDETTFEQAVLERSSEVPVVVDFWAAWCGPCRTLTPALESAARSREGRVDLAKVDVDANPRLSQAFRVQGIPAVKAFRDGALADEFTGALPPARVESFFDSLLPSEADELAEREDDEQALRRALELDPRHLGAATGLGRLLLRGGEPAEAAAVLERHPHDFLADGLAARARLSLEGGDLEPAWDAWDAGLPGEALELLQAAFSEAQGAERDLIRRAMVAIFTELGPGHELAREHRRRLSAAM
jgi:putative thioredoxin